jgi:hypothetical protein
MQLWFGMANVEQPPDVSLLGQAKGAYVNVVAPAFDAADFRLQVKQAVDEFGLALLGIEDVEPLVKKLSRETASEEVSRLMKGANQTGRVAFGAFYAYDSEDAAPADSEHSPSNHQEESPRNHEAPD